MAGTRRPSPHRLGYANGNSESVYTAPAPLISSCPPPVSIGELDAMWTDVEKQYLAGGKVAVKRALVIYQRAKLAWDRWSVRSGPDPFISFVRLVRRDLIIGPHHWLLARAFERIARKELFRLMIFMPPGHSKTLFASILLPAWLFGLNPRGRVLAASHSVALARDFGREIRDLLGSAEYRRLFPRTLIRSTAKAAHDWGTTARGKYQAIGVGTAAAGRRADMLGTIDDPISEQDAYSDARRGTVNDWYPGYRDRLMPHTPLVLMMTRRHVADLAGSLRKTAEANPRSEQWEVISIPAELTPAAAKLINEALPEGHEPVEVGRAPFPALWPDEELRNLRELFPPAYWSAVFMQQPTVGGGGIYRREWWRPWPADKTLPDIKYLIQVWDTAYDGEEERNDYCACTTWGVFQVPPEELGRDKRPRAAIILLSRYHKRVDFPTLREEAYAYYDRWDTGPAGPVNLVLIEPKASGKSLIQELHRKGVPVRPWNPERGGQGRELSKIASAHAASVVLYGGLVYYPEGRRWAEGVIQECVDFPSGEHDDLQDTCKIAWLWLRRSMSIKGDAVERDKSAGRGKEYNAKDGMGLARSA